MAKFRVGDETFDLSVAVGPSNGGPEQECTTFGSVTAIMDWKLGGTLTAVFAGNSPEAVHINELASDIWLLGDFPQRFRTWAVWQDWDADGDNRVSTQSVTYDRLLNRRLVNFPGGLNFNNVDQGEIVWQMWNHTQSLPGGDLGVTPGPRTTGVSRIRNFPMGDNLGQRAQELTDVENGLWWGIDSDLVYTAKMPADFEYLETPLQLGVNCRTMQRASTGSDFANITYGDGDAEETTPTVWGLVDIEDDPRGRWEKAFGWPDVKRQDTLEDHVRGELVKSLYPPTHWNIQMEASRWVSDSMLTPGMQAYLVVPPALAAPLSDPYTLVAVQVTSVSFNFTNDGSLDINVVAEERSRIAD